VGGEDNKLSDGRSRNCALFKIPLLSGGGERGGGGGRYNTSCIFPRRWSKRGKKKEGILVTNSYVFHFVIRKGKQREKERHQSDRLARFHPLSARKRKKGGGEKKSG